MTLQKLVASTVAALVVLVGSPAGFAAAGKVVFAYGQAAAINAGGERRDLSRGDEIEPGDLLKTLEGRMQVRFKDGGFVSLQPRTEFKVEEFRYAGAEDGSESAIFRLLRGGIRAVTGAVGTRNKQNYRVNTPVATIGIRGTAFYALMCAGGCLTPWGATLADGLYTGTGEGIIWIGNNAGIIDSPVNSTVYVQSIDTPPIETSAPPPTVSSTIAPSQVAATEADDDEGATDADSVFVAGEQFGEGGGQTIVVGDTPIQQLGDPSSFALLADSGQIFIGSGSGATDDSSPVGRASQFVFVDGVNISPDARTFRGANVFTPFFDGLVTGISSQNTDTKGSTSEIAVERFSGGIISIDVEFVDSGLSQFDGSSQQAYVGNESRFQVTGRPVNSIPSSGQAFFSMAGSSNSATVINGPLGAGAVSAQLSVDFGTSSVDLQYQVDHLGTLYSAFHSAEPLLNTVGAVSKAYTFGSNGGVAFGGLGACSGGCGSVVGGFLAGNTQTALGNTPAAAGFSYTVFETNPILGGVALKLDSVTTGP